MIHHGFFAVGDAGFDSGLENLSNYVVGKTSGASPAWPNTPQSAVDALVSAYTQWHAAYQKTFGAHTPVDTKAKNDENNRKYFGNAFII